MSSGASQFESSAAKAEADEIEEMPTLLQAAPDRDAEFMAEMQDMVDQIRLQMAEIAAANGQIERHVMRG